MNREQHLVPCHDATPDAATPDAATPDAATEAKSRATLRHLHTFLSGQPVQIGPVHVVLRPGSGTPLGGIELMVRWRALEVVLGPGEHSWVPQVRIGGLDRPDQAPGAVPAVRSPAR